MLNNINNNWIYTEMLNTIAMFWNQISFDLVTSANRDYFQFYANLRIVIQNTSNCYKIFYVNKLLFNMKLKSKQFLINGAR